MFLLKAFAILAFHITILMQAWGQWKPVLSNAPPDQSVPCRGIEIRVTDSTGLALMDATITAQNTGLRFSTNFKGIAEIPCIANQEARILDISAPGYRTSRVAIPWGNCVLLEVELDRQAIEPPCSEKEINVRELTKEIRAKSRDLQVRAARDIRDKDYGHAEALLLQALALTPSDAGITNLLGIIALRCDDLAAASVWFEKTAKLAPNKGESWGNLGLARWMQRRKQDSYDLLIKAESMGEISELSHYIIGIMNLAKGLDKEAIEHLKKISAKRFPDRDLHMSAALRNIGKIRAAENTYRNYLKHQTASAAMAQVLGMQRRELPFINLGAEIPGFR